MAETITQALTQDHKTVMRDVGAVRSDPRLAPSLYPAIADAIRRHAVAEEGTLYQALRRRSDMDHRMVAMLENGHRQLVSILAALDRTPYGTPVFAAGFLQMSQVLAEHVGYEERVVFPHAEKVLSSTVQRTLARRYKQRMGETRRRNVAITAPRKTNCACKNPCSCASCGTGNPVRRVRPKWYHHFAGAAAPIVALVVGTPAQTNAAPRRTLTWPSPYTAPPRRRYSTTFYGGGPTYG